MRLVVDFNISPNILVPITSHKRSYHALMTRRVRAGSELYVQDSRQVKVKTLINIADVTLGSYEGSQVGYLFYTTFSHQNEAAFLLAYSNTRQSSLDGVEAVFKSDTFLVYHRPNTVTLVVTPQIASAILGNLEI